MNYNTAEKEVIGLCVALEAIDDIANHALLDLLELRDSPGEAEVRYKSRIHQQLFLLRLLDFVKENGDETLTGIRGSCLKVLTAACESRTFDFHGSVAGLQQATRALDCWLTLETTLELWLPTLELDAKLTVPRIEFLYILGNHAKHNLARLTGISKHIAGILAQHGHRVEVEQVPLALDDFREHLQEDYFAYYGTWLAELVNNVRWGIHDYLQPAFQRAYYRVPGEDLMYRYNYPDSITHEAPRAWFWRLMNHARGEPFLKRFVGARYMKKEVLHG